MVKDFLESMWPPYPREGLSYGNGWFENDYPKIFPDATSFYLFFKNNYLCTLINFFFHAHIFWNDFMMLFWQEDLISSEIPLRSHVKHTQQGFLFKHWVLGLSGQSEAATRVRDHFVSGEACLWFDPRVQVTGIELKSPPLCSGLAWALLSCVVGPTVSWIRDTPTTGVDPCQAPIQGLFLWPPHQAHSLLLTLVAVFLSRRPQEWWVPQTPDVRSGSMKTSTSGSHQGHPLTTRCMIFRFRHYWEVENHCSRAWQQVQGPSAREVRAMC